MRNLFHFGLLAVLLGCSPQPERIATVSTPSLAQRGANVYGGQKNFRTVVAAIAPVAQRVCRESSPSIRCDYAIQLDPNPSAPPNAFQTLDRNDRPVIIFTQSIINLAQNNDELALIMGHESAHHIMGHIQQQQAQAMGAGILFGLGAALAGADAQTIEAASSLGQSAGSLAYSKQHELEADQLGARIAKAAGFDPLNGVAFFTRIPDPGDQFLSTHPGNRDRYQVVRNAVGAY